MTNKYGVYKDIEYYIRVNKNRYHYEHICSSYLINTFDNLDDAIKYIDNNNLNIDKYANSLYADSFSIFELNEKDEIISDNIYYKAYSYEDLQSDLDIKIINY